MTSVPSNYILRKKGTTKCLTRDVNGLALGDCHGSIHTNPNNTIIMNNVNTNASQINFLGSSQLNSNNYGQILIVPKSADNSTFSLDSNGNFISTRALSDSAFGNVLNKYITADDLTNAAKLTNSSQCITDYRNTNWKSMWNSIANNSIKDTITAVTNPDGTIGGDIYKYANEPYVKNNFYDNSIDRPNYQIASTNKWGYTYDPTITPNKQHKYYHKCADPYCYESCSGDFDAKCAANHNVDMYDPAIPDFDVINEFGAVVSHGCYTIAKTQDETATVPRILNYLYENNCADSVPLGSTLQSATTLVGNLTIQQSMDRKNILLQAINNNLNNISKFLEIIYAHWANYKYYSLDVLETYINYWWYQNSSGEYLVADSTHTAVVNAKTLLTSFKDDALKIKTGYDNILFKYNYLIIIYNYYLQNIATITETNLIELLNNSITGRINMPVTTLANIAKKVVPFTMQESILLYNYIFPIKNPALPCNQQIPFIDTTISSLPLIDTIYRAICVDIYNAIGGTDARVSSCYDLLQKMQVALDKGTTYKKNIYTLSSTPVIASARTTTGNLAKIPLAVPTSLDITSTAVAKYREGIVDLFKYVPNKLKITKYGITSYVMNDLTLQANLTNYSTYNVPRCLVDFVPAFVNVNADTDPMFDDVVYAKNINTWIPFSYGSDRANGNSLKNVILNYVNGTNMKDLQGNALYRICTANLYA